MALCYKVNWRTKGTLLLKKRKVGIAGPLGHCVRDARLCKIAELAETAKHPPGSPAA